MAGVPHKFVSGYRGQAGTILALQRGEVDAADMGITIFLAKAASMRDGKDLAGVLQRGVLNDKGELVRHRLLADIPTAVEALKAIAPAKLNSTEFKAYKIVVGTFNVQFGFTLPPKTDDRIVATLRKAITAALASDEAKNAAKKVASFDYDFIDGAAAEKELAELRADMQKDPAVHKLLLRLMSPKK